MKNWITRSLSGIIYIAIIVTCVLLGGWWLQLLCFFFGIAALLEFKRLTVKERESSLNTVIDVLGMGILLGAYYQSISDIAILFMGWMLVRLTAQLYTKDANPINSLLSSLAAQLYVIVPIALLFIIAQKTSSQFLLLMFVLIWINDTGAFVVGSTMGQHGRHRLFPRHSPKKSWEGFIGGLLFSIAAAVGARYLFPNYFGGFEVWQLAIYGAVVSAFATWGDLFESMIKRSVGVKDSGSIMPGHGGMLDRIDSLLFVTPATIFFLMLTL